MSNFPGDFFLDPGIEIKQEPTSTVSSTTTTSSSILQENNINISASVPIPVRGRDQQDYRDLGLYFESPSSSYQDQLVSQVNADLFQNNMMWGTRLDMDVIKSDSLIHMDEDDIFQVDKADLIQGPTLAELNANDETLLGNLNFDDILLPDEGTYNYNNLTQNNTCVTQKYISSQNNNNNNNNNNLNNNNNHNRITSSFTQPNFYRENTNLMVNNVYDYNTKNSSDVYSTNENSAFISSTPSPTAPVLTPFQQKRSTLHELLMKRENYGGSPDRTILGKSVPGPSTSPVVNTQSTKIQRSHISRLSSSAPTHLGLEQIWQRREPRPHLLSTGSLAEAGSTSSLSTGGVLSPEGHDFSHDEYDSDEDSEHYEDVSSDIGDSDDDDESNSKASASKKERYFWQYNVQAKGPKGQRLVMKCKMEDPHVLNEVTDPVFSPDCSVRGIKHSGKARKGDGNDLTPNARKLYNIGKELDKLGRIINDMTPVSELPFNVRPKTRKEKNKLASRACRLKKKAQHEANKIKLHGLENEHKKLINGIQQLKQIVVVKVGDTPVEKQEECVNRMDKIVRLATKIKIAGQTTEYVNRVLDRIKSGVSSSILEDL